MPQAPSVGGFPVVFFKLDIVLPQINSNRAQRLEIELLHIFRRRLQDHLQLQVLEQPIGVLPVASVGRPTRGLHIGNPVRLRSQHAQECLGRHRSRPHFDVIGLLQYASPRGPKSLQPQDELLKRQRIGGD